MNHAFSAHRSSDLTCENVTVFDFLNPTTKSPIYWYWPNYPDFTFSTEFTKNDPLLVKNVILNVLTTSGSIVSIEAVYNNAKRAWISTHKFNSQNLPINIDVSYDVIDSVAPLLNDIAYLNLKEPFVSSSGIKPKNVTIREMTNNFISYTFELDGADNIIYKQNERISSYNNNITDDYIKNDIKLSNGEIASVYIKESTEYKDDNSIISKNNIIIPKSMIENGKRAIGTNNSFPNPPDPDLDVLLEDIYDNYEFAERFQ